jgi:hypothetical protein
MVIRVTAVGERTQHATEIARTTILCVRVMRLSPGTASPADAIADGFRFSTKAWLAVAVLSHADTAVTVVRMSTAKTRAVGVRHESAPAQERGYCQAPC